MRIPTGWRAARSSLKAQTIPEGRRSPMAEGYCVKCKGKKEMVGPQDVVLKNGKKAVKGTCPDCGTGMFKITGKA